MPNWGGVLEYYNPAFSRRFLYFSVPPQFLQDWPESCRTPQDSAGLQAKVLILVASPAKLGRVSQSLEELGRT